MNYLSLKSFWLLTVILVFSVSPAYAGSSGIVEEWSVMFPSLQYFNWEEFDRGGEKLLREEGLLVGTGGSVRLDLYKNRLMLKARGELFGGDVHYNGETQDGRPVKTDVIYFGTRAEGDLGWRFTAGSGSFEPFAGLGYRWWLRALQGSVTDDADRSPVSGSDEIWQSLYTRIGGRAAWRFSGDLSLFAEAGGKYPLYNRNRADSPDGGRVTVKPGREWSAFAEVGLTWKSFRPTLTYEGFRFSRSAAVPIGNGRALLQPRSNSDIFGLNLNWLF